MKQTFTLSLLFLTLISFGQNLESDNLWRTKGVYDSLGNFVERAKIQSFLYISEANQIERLHAQDKINMETGETTVFIYRDTLVLKPLEGSIFTVSDNETLTIHSKDSLTIHYNNFNISYVKLNLPQTKLKYEAVELVLLDKTMRQNVEGEENYNFTYQNNSLVKVKPLNRDSDWESDYKLINFNGFVIIQGIVSPSKLVTAINEKEIQFIEIDYRFENKNGVLKEIQ